MAFRAPMAIMACFLFLPVTQASGTTYYINPTGSDNNDGLTRATSFRTLQHAADLTRPGDTVRIMPGVYREHDVGGVVTIRRSGKPQAYITYTADDKNHRPKLHVTKAWQHIKIPGAAYIEISDLDIEGDNANISLKHALQQRHNRKYPATNTVGIWIEPSENGLHFPHHITIRNNHIRMCAGHGVGTHQADYLRIENNTIDSNAWYTAFGESGISLWKLRDIDRNTGYKNFVIGNRVFNNESLIPRVETGKIEDGNGIIVDSTIENHYQGRTLIANNTVFNNGGAGIQVFRSNHVDIVHNTAYMNSKTPTIHYASIYASSSSDAKILNNIMYAKTGAPVNDNAGNSNVVYDYNIYYNGELRTHGANDIIADPLFKHPGTDAASADFHLRQDSPGVKTAMRAAGIAKDLGDILGFQGITNDRGAYAEK